MAGKKTIKFIFENENLFVRYTRSAKGKYVSLGKDGYLRDSRLINNKILVRSIFIDKSMKHVKPKSFAGWFKNCYRALVISGLENLCGDDAETVASMFENCYCVKDLNFGKFSLPNCRRYDRMFYRCESLRTLKAPKLRFITKSAQPFYGCNRLNKCEADISVTCNLPLYDRRVKVVCSEIDSFGAKLTDDGVDIEKLHQQNLENRKSKTVLSLEKDILNAFFSEPNNEAITKLLGQLSLESARCGLSVIFDWNLGIFKYDFLIENLTDKTRRSYVANRQKKSLFKRKSR